MKWEMNKTILTVDDCKSIRQVVSFTLQEAGYNVIEACDGQDALNKISNSTLHMVVTDLNMPNVDGIGLIKKIRMDANHKFIPILMLTTESQNEKKMEAKTAGATGWIVKPFKPEQLLAVVKKILG
jgi:two-component system, chemotaxis family, chemotaxis protein CheY